MNPGDPRNIDEWFRKVREKYADQMQCGRGCTACCYGLFDISLADAAAVAEGFRKLPREIQQSVSSKAAEISEKIRETAPELQKPAILSEHDPRIDQIVDAANSPACPFLGSAGDCLIYEHRPLACRLEGVPMVDVRHGLFGDWCELNFTEGVPQSALSGLAQDYDRIDAMDAVRSAVVAARAGLKDARAITFIPSVIAEYDRFWKNLSDNESKQSKTKGE